MDEVFQALKEKYDITDREEQIIQVCMMWLPLFKDRGTVSSSKEDGLGIDFIRNYLTWGIMKVRRQGLTENYNTTSEWVSSLKNLEKQSNYLDNLKTM